MSDERQGRKEAVAEQRRRRDDTNLGSPLKMVIPEDVRARLKAEGRTPRWVNDERNRIYNLTVKDDYDKVEGVEPIPTGDVDPQTGEPVMAHLLSKRDDFIAEDEAKKEQRRKEVERAMVQGKVPGAPGAEPQPVRGQQGAQTYVTASTSIGRGNQIIE